MTSKWYCDTAKPCEHKGEDNSCGYEHGCGDQVEERQPE